MILKIMSPHCRYMAWCVTMHKLMELNSALFIDDSSHELTVIHSYITED